MASKMVRVDQKTWEALKELSTQTGEPMQRVLARSVEALRRQHVLKETNAAYAALREDPEAWKEEQVERGEWEVTLADGLNDQ